MAPKPLRRDDRFMHDFEDTLNPISTFGNDITQLFSLYSAVLKLLP